jgi:hypothetical protein
MIRMRGYVVLGFSVIVIAPWSGGTATSAQQQLTGVSFVCATQSAGPPSEFRAIVADLMREHGDRAIAKWGDRAALVQLDAKGTYEYLVPLTCGATGNCIWAVLASSPPRSLGVVDGSFLTIQSTRHGWAEIHGYSG